jgi:ketosteroid isomerase-like protein
MTKADTHADVLRRALKTSVLGDVAAARDLYTKDVRAWSPALDVWSREELLAQQFSHFDAFTDIEVDANVDVVGERAYAEWKITATHSGPFAVDDIVVEASGNRLSLHGVTVAEFEGDRIAALRQYWDERELIAGLGPLPS